MHIISGEFKGKRLTVPKGDVTRPTSGMMRESLFNICQSYIENARFLDLFAGSGAIGLEALSRGANSVVFVENNRESHRCILQNIDHLKVKEKAQAFCTDVFSSIEKLEKLQKKFDIIFADPPYSTIRVIKHEPVYYSHHLLTVLDKLSILPSGGTLFIEEGAEVPDIEIPLHTLMLKSSRRSGHSVLKEYQKS